ncbi:histone-lysine N-methyltransferase SETDB2 isoform X3 [Triplophysa dalaica]|uniref:histone-lysine N-methyltransferase SETDB2 isoform X3 n=1 Tax=Triplophysa dalaica TaxID=1582913 RepID=UPI0024DFA220|nr:histone-lysine N-methyltransferase SETDB2 isoform X3 [Triplophysa dalaica]
MTAEMESDTERARIFWQEMDVDGVFDQLLDLLQDLREAITTHTASDRDYVKAMKIILESEVSVLKNEGIEEVLIDEDILTVTVQGSQCSPDHMKNSCVTDDLLQDASRRSKDTETSSDYSQMSSASRNEALCSHDLTALMSPLSVCSEDPDSPVPLDFQPHDCSPACVPLLLAHADHFLGHNPFRVPMLCQFQRHCVRIHPSTELEEEMLEVLYTAPCGRSLHSMEAVLDFLLQSDSLGRLQPDNFTFNPQIVPERQTQRHAPGPPSVLFERDLSRGVEPVPVSLCNEVDRLRPKEFRYRKERWPHGCFLGAAPFFSVCCDCTDGCADVQKCACLQLSVRGGTDEQEHQSYKHMRLDTPVNAGLFECGPWCGCERARCQNRVVQRGLRVRLQVFRTLDRGWAVRCQDDLDMGTFICIYAGVVLRREQSVGPVTVKSGEAQVSDDEVEVVDEWTLPTESSGKEPPERSPPLHVPVIQRPADQPGHTQHKQVISSPDCSEAENEDVLRKKMRLTESKGHRDGGEVTSDGDVYYLSASTEGNVARFINHSCDPNLFVQNIFVDTHDPKFPLVAFFTNRTIKAGTELTWNYSYTEGSRPDHEVSCRCGNATCQELII